MFLKMLIENECEYTGMRKEHGLSIYIEFQGSKILFDTGATGSFADNAAKMGISVKDVDKLIISHAHSDHSGGLSRFLELNGKAPVYISRGATQDYYVKLLFAKENISTPKILFEKYSDRICFVDSFTEIHNNVFLVTKFIRRYSLVKSSKELLVRRDGRFYQDQFDHELALVVDDGGMLIVITGCSHNGVDNMVETVKGLFPQKSIKSLIGGFHLMGFRFPIPIGEGRKNIVALGSRLLDYGIEKTYTCHCTGNRGFRILKETMGDRIDYFSTGKQLEL